MQPSDHMKTVGCQDIYTVDTKFLGHDRHTAVYVVDAEKTAIVDTGASPNVEQVLKSLDELGKHPTDIDYIFPSHLHLDHAGGTGYLAEECVNATVVAHEFAVPYLTDNEGSKIDELLESVHRTVGELEEGYGTLKAVSGNRVQSVSGGEIIDLGDRDLEVIHAPGHAPHQVCFYETKNTALFTADELGMYLGGELVPTTPPPTFDLEKNLDSVEHLEGYGADVLLYPHYGGRQDVEEAFDEFRNSVVEWVDEVHEVWQELRDKEAVVEEFRNREHIYYSLWDDLSARETIRMDVEGALLYLQRSGKT